MTKTIQVEDFIMAQHFQDTRYKIINCHPAIGIIYLINNFLSGDVRVHGGPNGQYPYHYKEMIDNIFGVSNNAIEVCSNSIQGNSNSISLCYCLTTVDIRPETNPDYVADG